MSYLRETRAQIACATTASSNTSGLHVRAGVYSRMPGRPGFIELRQSLHARSGVQGHYFAAEAAGRTAEDICAELIAGETWIE